MRLRGAIVCAVGATVVSCFRPSAPAGAPCADNGDCPAPYECSLANTCTTSDAVIDGPSVVDGNPQLDAPSDGSRDAAAATCWDHWRTGTEVLGAPRLLDVLSPASTHEIDPSLSADELTLYFARSSATNTPTMAYRAQRASKQSAFGAPVVATEVQLGTESVTRVTASADGSELLFSSTRSGGQGGNDLWITRKLGPTYTAPSETLLAAVDTVETELDPELAASGLALYFTRIHGSPPTSQDVWVTTRSAIDAPFATPTRVPFSPGANTIADPVLSPDELILLGSTVIGSRVEIFVATRTTVGATFDFSELLDFGPGTNSQGDPALSRDGCELFFSGTNGGTLRDLYVVSVQ